MGPTVTRPVQDPLAVLNLENQLYIANGCKELLITVLFFFLRPLGLFSILDEESKFPSAKDSTFIAKLDSNLKDKSAGIYSR